MTHTHTQSEQHKREWHEKERRRNKKVDSLKCQKPRKGIHFQNIFRNRERRRMDEKVMEKVM